MATRSVSTIWIEVLQRRAYSQPGFEGKIGVSNDSYNYVVLPSGRFGQQIALDAISYFNSSARNGKSDPNSFINKILTSRPYIELITTMIRCPHALGTQIPEFVEGSICSSCWQIVLLTDLGLIKSAMYLFKMDNKIYQDQSFKEIYPKNKTLINELSLELEQKLNPPRPLTEEQAKSVYELNFASKKECAVTSVPHLLFDPSYQQIFYTEQSIRTRKNMMRRQSWRDFNREVNILDEKISHEMSVQLLHPSIVKRTSEKLLIDYGKKQICHPVNVKHDLTRPLIFLNNMVTNHQSLIAHNSILSNLSTNTWNELFTSSESDTLLEENVMET